VIHDTHTDETHRPAYQPIHDYSHPQVNDTQVPVVKEEQEQTQQEADHQVKASSEAVDTIAQNAVTEKPPQEEYRPLNGKDALTYLDTVKAKFSSRTDVYNKFLDIMKDFKSQM